MQRVLSFLSVGVFLLSLTGCLGTVVEARTPQGPSFGTTSVRIIAAPSAVDARHCRLGMSTVTTSVPIWGVVVGILTFGILVPITTTFTCVAE
jgi:hypothetical protein